MTHLPRRIQPPFTLYTLRAEPGTRNSPPVPAVHLIEEESETGHRHVTTHTLTPEQARDLAAELVRAANHATSSPMGRVLAVASTVNARAHRAGIELSSVMAGTRDVLIVAADKARTPDLAALLGLTVTDDAVLQADGSRTRHYEGTVDGVRVSTHYTPAQHERAVVVDLDTDEVLTKPLPRATAEATVAASLRNVATQEVSA